MKNKLIYNLKRYLTLDGYSVAPVHIQLLLLLILSFGFIFIFGLFYGSFSDSYYAFMDPTSIPLEGNIFLVIIELIIGLIIASFVISVLSSALENFIAEIKKGILPFTRKGHLVFINQNDKLFYIFDELNIKYKDLDIIQEIVLILSSDDEVELLLEELEDYSNLSIFVKFGNLYDVATYSKFALKDCQNITILIDKSYENDFEADNNSIKILSTIVQDKGINLLDKNITIESLSTDNVVDIYSAITKLYNFQHIAYLNPKELLGQLLTRSMIDVTYYKIYDQIFTFDGFEIYIKEAKDFISQDTLFKDIMSLSNNSLLFGYMKGNNVMLNQFNDTITLIDKLIFIAEDENSIKLSLNKDHTQLEPITINQPSEIVNRKICMLGDALKVENLFEFLDLDSQQRYKEYIFDDYKQYVDNDFIEYLYNAKYDTVIINMSEEQTLRYILLLVSKFGRDNIFVNNCISIITNPHSAKIINEITGKSNVIISQRLSAQFISQLCFDSYLIDIVNELTTSVGAEFNLLDTEKEKLTKLTKYELKEQLMNNSITYIGIVSKKGIVELNSENISSSQSIIVLSDGIN